jgi:hypothetical protein
MNKAQIILTALWAIITSNLWWVSLTIKSVAIPAGIMVGLLTVMGAVVLTWGVGTWIIGHWKD